jgi:hypothetical protein
MTITLYVRKSDPYAQMEQVLTDLRMSYALCFKEENPEMGRHLGITESPVLVIDGRCTFVSPEITPEVFRLLVQSCTEDSDRAGDTGAKHEG